MCQLRVFWTRRALGFVLATAGLLWGTSVAAQEVWAGLPTPSLSTSPSTVSGGQPSGSGAEAPETQTGFEGAVRLGYAFAMGEYFRDAEVSDVMSGAIPLQIELGYRVIPNLTIGFYFAYRFVLLKDDVRDDCEDIFGTGNCSAYSMRFGFQLHYHFSPQDAFDPWLGGGFGYEWSGLRASYPPEGWESNEQFTGMEWLTLEGGFQLNIAERGFIGPFLSFTVGQFSGYSYSESDGDYSSSIDIDIEEKAPHHWLVFGLRGGFGP